MKGCHQLMRLVKTTFKKQLSLIAGFFSLIYFKLFSCVALSFSLNFIDYHAFLFSEEKNEESMSIRNVSSTAPQHDTIGVGTYANPPKDPKADGMLI